MQKHIGWLWVIGFFGLVAAANAQTPSPPTVTTKFDGTYAFVSGAKVNESYTTWDEHPGPCPDLPPSTPLTIINGQVRFDQQEGTVGPNGELSARLIPTPFGKGAATWASKYHTTAGSMKTARFASVGSAIIAVMI